MLTLLLEGEGIYMMSIERKKSDVRRLRQLESMCKLPMIQLFLQEWEMISRQKSGTHYRVRTDGRC